MKVLAAILISLVAVASSAGELYGVTMPATQKVGEVNLLLNGMGVRRVRRFGFPIKVYVGGLYLKEKSTDSDAIVDSKGPKYIVMDFLQNVDREPLVDGYEKSYYQGCVVECDNKSLFAQFEKLIVNVRKGNKTLLTFEDDRITVENTGPNANKGTIESAALSKNVLAMYISKKSKTAKKLRVGLLGL